MDIVASVLEKAAQDSLKIDVQKHLELDIDEGTLLASDYNAFDTHSLKTQQETYLRLLTRDNVQLLLNKIWELPTERVEEAIVAKLPWPKFVLPRAQRIPKPRPLTKWQQFAKDKGISSSKKKKPKLSWDEQLQKWIPNYGYRRAEAEKQKEWLVEVGDNAEPTKDLFAAKATAKQEKVAKNELQRLRNLAKAKNIKVPRVGITNSDYYRDARQIATAVTVARSSTASVGKFQSKLPKEKDARNVRDLVPGAKRVRGKAPPKPQDEAKHNMNLVDSILSKRPAVLMSDSISSSQATTQRTDAKSRKKPAKKGAKKPKAGKGKRDTKSKVGGRKRR